MNLNKTFSFILCCGYVIILNFVIALCYCITLTSFKNFVAFASHRKSTSKG